MLGTNDVGSRMTKTIEFPVPPKSIEISNYINNSAVVVKQHEMIPLSCVVGQSKPPAEIKWFRNNAEIHQPGQYNSRVSTGMRGTELKQIPPA